MILLDEHAIKLATRLGGLPLALATAGTFLASSDMLCQEYLQLYESEWSEIVGTESDILFEYEDRTLASTWSISLANIRARDSEAATLFELFAYLSPSHIWYELVHALADDTLPWCALLTKNRLRFQRAMSLVLSYSMADLNAESYSLHPCLHDWTVLRSATPVDMVLFSAVVIGLSDLMKSSLSEEGGWEGSMRLLDHIDWITGPKFAKTWEDSCHNPRICTAAYIFGRLYVETRNFPRAQLLIELALKGQARTEISGRDELWETLYLQGSLHILTGRCDLGENILTQALDGFTQIHGVSGESTLRTIRKLGVLYTDEGKMDLAIAMCSKVLALDLHNTSDTTARIALKAQTLSDLGHLYHYQGDLKRAEAVSLQAITEREPLSDLDRVYTGLMEDTSRLALIYFTEGKFDDAAAMVDRSLTAFRLSVGHQRRNLRVLYGLVEALQLRMKINFSRSEPFDTFLSEMLLLAGRLSHIQPFFLDKIGRTFIDPLNDEANAQEAFNQFFNTLEEQASVFRYEVTYVRCDGCQVPINRKTGRCICKKCPDMDICAACLPAYVSGSLAIYDCAGHEMFVIKNEYPKPPSIQNDVTLEDWLRRVKVQYNC